MWQEFWKSALSKKICMIIHIGLKNYLELWIICDTMYSMCQFHKLYVFRDFICQSLVHLSVFYICICLSLPEWNLIKLTKDVQCTHLICMWHRCSFCKIPCCSWIPFLFSSHDQRGNCSLVAGLLIK